MRKLSFKLLSALLAVCMLFSTMSMLAFAEQKTDEIAVLVEEGFDGFDLGHSFVSGTTQNVYSSAANGATIVSDPQTTGGTRGNVAKLKSDLGSRFGISTATLQASDYYKENSALPNKIKFEFDYWKTPGGGYTLVKYGNAYAAGQLLRINSDGSVLLFTDPDGGTNGAGTGDTVTDVLEAGKWVNYVIYFDVTTEKASLYVDKKFVSDWTISGHSWSLAGANFVISSSALNDHVDNIRVSAYEDFKLVSTDFVDGASGTQKFTATFNQDLGAVDNSSVSIASGNTAVTEYNVTYSGKVMTITFTEELKLSKSYTVTLKSNIKNTEGVMLGTDAKKTFETRNENEISVLVKEDFEGFNSGDTISKSASGSVDSTGRFYTAAADNATIENDPVKGKVAELISGLKQFGISANTLKASDYYKANSALPSKIKFEFDYWKTASTGTTSYTSVRYGNPWAQGQLIQINANGSVMVFTDVSSGSGTGTPYSAASKTGEWVNYVIYLDITNKEASLYIDGAFVADWTIKGYSYSLANANFTVSSGTASDRVDNIKISAYEDFKLVDTSITDGQTEVDAGQKTITATFNHTLGAVNNNFVEVSDGTSTTPNYSVTADGKVMTVTFPNGVGNGKTYTVTFKGDIASVDGLKVGADTTITFTTIAQYEPSGFTSTMASFDFDDGSYSINDIISPDATYNYDKDKKYYISNSINATIVDGGEGHGLAVSVPKNNWATRFGIYSAYVQKTSAYANYGTYPDLLKFEVEIKKDSTASAYVCLGVYFYAVLIDGSGNVKTLNQSGGAADQSSTVKAPNGQWNKITVYADRIAKEVVVYINDKFVCRQTGITGTIGNEFLVYPSGGDIMADNFELSTLPALASPVIGEYRNLAGEKKMIFLGKNKSGTAAKDYKVICAEYNNNLLVDTTVVDGSITAKKNEIKDIQYHTPAAGNYVKYFVWEGFDTMVPLVNSLEKR